MSGWTGFSEEELRKIQQNDSAAPAAAGRVRKAVLANRSRQQLQREKGLLRSAAQRSSGAGSPSLPLDQQLTKPPLKEEAPPPPAVPTPNEEMKATGDHWQPPEEQETPAVIELEKEEVELREKTRLELLQQEQKIMEEKNKRKKALLAKTIAEKSKQTQAEAVKLRRIQKELQALDDSMSNGIGILRSRIEQASMEYSAARKRYERAEVEFVTSKVDLHKKAEVKEQLTEHLCTIIQQNELRKARKLEELMQQLQLHAAEEEQLEEEEEEEQERNRSGENQDGAVQSTQDTKEEEEEVAGAAGAQPKAEEDLQTIETLVQREVLAS